MLAAIIVAAGSSRRVGFDKLTASLAGEPLIVHTIRAFARANSVTQILMVARKDRLAEFEKLFSASQKSYEVVAGGEHRQDSVKAGLARLDSNIRYVAVHDGARPLITPAEIERVVDHARAHGAAALAEPVRDTLKQADENLRVSKAIDRQQLYAMQTPQVFKRKLLEEAYRAVYEAGSHVTDEVSAVESFGQDVFLVPSEDFNFKITYERDLRLAECVLRERQQKKRVDD